MEQIALDGDIFLYQCGFACEEEPLHVAKKTLDRMVDRCLRETDSDEYVVFLTGKGNFRDEVATLQGYKANRKERPKPKHLADLREHFIDKHDAIVVDGMEADDALVEWLTDPEGTNRTIATADKDLNMVPGIHYNPNKMETDFVTPIEGMRFFFTQLLTGDSTDNIPGLYKLTGQKATKKIKEPLHSTTSPTEMLDYVAYVYKEHSGESEETVANWLDEIGSLLWIRQYGLPDWRMLLEESSEAESTEDTR